MKIKHFSYLSGSFLVLIFCLNACISIPKQAPQLSGELGTRIRDMQGLHLSLLKKYFDYRREQVNLFIDSVWTPRFIENTINNKDIRAMWEEAKKADKVGKFFQEAIPYGITEINVRRESMLKPLTEVEDQTRTQLIQAYEEIFAINNSITSFLSSAAKVAENRERYLNLLGVKQEEIQKTMSSVDGFMSKLNTQGGLAEDKIKQYLADFEALKGLFKQKSNPAESKKD